ncbi:hypothetical protein BCR33DRAFT_748209 [Rhizoclosmatium globosum]|uniref:Endonuclease/exonuclease/phosphatase domain-containing protein n=1 Tax=Rhizoclosmatium globosum TaxID=329046 RepID=A0A1Y2AMS6_9FUNG|nr:hypothetical protein BCR33DRAFT_748209 [Rhizoclosmatium globosum]|eukprot:ORY23883.1 hypothetical protein BCR33DRAFT_748209 [Rhizoclosmatium globosum]
MPGNPKHSSEGRITNLHLPNLTVVNTYLPSGNRTADRHNYKLEFQDDLKTHCEQLRITRDVILVGDFNTIRNYTDVLQGLETDIVDQFPSTTTPDEKTWLNSLETLFTDSFREKYSQTGATWLIKAPSTTLFGVLITYGLIKEYQSKHMTRGLKPQNRSPSVITLKSK